jgi:parallel beta-helix repeat protein
MAHRLAAAALVALLAACGGKDVFYVDAAKGSDGNPGTADRPFKTIGRGLAAASGSRATVQVAPGRYDVSSGEHFPLRIPGRVILLGDEAHKGSGATPTAIVGGGHVSTVPVGTYLGIGATIEPGAGSTIAGFTIVNDNAVGLPYAHGLSVDGTNAHVTIRNNTVTGVHDGSALMLNGGYRDDGHCVITGNHIIDNGTGISFRSGLGSKVENNVITGNLHAGVEYWASGVDLGGGAAGSAGGNVISCNLWTDLYVIDAVTQEVSAANNLWDHVPPADGCLDICNQGTAVITTTGAALAASPCP